MNLDAKDRYFHVPEQIQDGVQTIEGRGTDVV